MALRLFRPTMAGGLLLLESELGVVEEIGGVSIVEGCCVSSLD